MSTKNVQFLYLWRVFWLSRDLWPKLALYISTSEFLTWNAVSTNDSHNVLLIWYPKTAYFKSFWNNTYSTELSKALYFLISDVNHCYVLMKLRIWLMTLTNTVKILASINYSLVWTRIRVEIWSMRSGSWRHGAWSRLAHTRWILSPTSPGYDFSISLSRRNIFIFPGNERSSQSFYPRRYQANESHLRVHFGSRECCFWSSLPRKHTAPFFLWPWHPGSSLSQHRASQPCVHHHSVWLLQDPVYQSCSIFLFLFAFSFFNFIFPNTVLPFFLTPLTVFTKLAN